MTDNHYDIFSCDYHVHSEFSPCSEDTNIREIARLSSEKKVEITITDHSYRFYLDSMARFSERDIEKTIDRTAARRNIMNYMEKMKRFNVNIGSEIDILPCGEMLFENDILDSLHVKLGAVHYLDSIHNGKNYDEVIEEFKKLNLAFINAGVDIIAHPFRILGSNGIDVDESLILWLTKHARGKAALEVNAHKKFPELDVKMVRKCCEYGTQVSIGTDSHRMAELFDFSYHRKIFEDSGADNIEKVIFNIN
jgi:DNA polymerase (family 10)